MPRCRWKRCRAGAWCSLRRRSRCTSPALSDRNDRVELGTHEAGDLGPYGRSRIAHRPGWDIDAADMADQDLACHRQTGRQYDGEAGVLSEFGRRNNQGRSVPDPLSDQSPSRSDRRHLGRRSQPSFVHLLATNVRTPIVCGLIDGPPFVGIMAAKQFFQSGMQNRSAEDDLTVAGLYVDALPRCISQGGK